MYFQNNNSTHYHVPSVVMQYLRWSSNPPLAQLDYMHEPQDMHIKERTRGAIFGQQYFTQEDCEIIHSKKCNVRLPYVKHALNDVKRMDRASYV